MSGSDFPSIRQQSGHRRRKSAACSAQLPTAAAGKPVGESGSSRGKDPVKGGRRRINRWRQSSCLAVGDVRVKITGRILDQMEHHGTFQVRFRLSSGRLVAGLCQ